MKTDTHSKYPPMSSDLAQRAFLTIWAGLAQWHQELVLVGGLVPKYICSLPPKESSMLHPVTLDVDIGIAFGVDGGQYGDLRSDLARQGFLPSSNPSRFERSIQGVTVPVDFLTEHPSGMAGSTQIAGITANIMPGVERALALAQDVTVCGVDLYGVEQKLTARVCAVGPFLALKLRAFYGRQAPKDAFDIFYTIKYYQGGSEAAMLAFAEEVRAGNRACGDALKALREHFSSEQHSAPVRAGHFLYEESNHSGDVRERRALIAQEVAAIGKRMLAMCGIEK